MHCLWTCRGSISSESHPIADLGACFLEDGRPLEPSRARSGCGAVDGADARAVLAVWGVRRERVVLALSHTCS